MVEVDLHGRSWLDVLGDYPLRSGRGVLRSRLEVVLEVLYCLVEENVFDGPLFDGELSEGLEEKGVIEDGLEDVHTLLEREDRPCRVYLLPLLVRHQLEPLALQANAERVEGEENGEQAVEGRQQQTHRD